MNNSKIYFGANNSDYHLLQNKKTIHLKIAEE